MKPLSLFTFRYSTLVSNFRPNKESSANAQVMKQLIGNLRVGTIHLPRTTILKVG